MPGIPCIEKSGLATSSELDAFRKEQQKGNQKKK